MGAVAKLVRRAKKDRQYAWPCKCCGSVRRRVREIPNWHHLEHLGGERKSLWVCADCIASKLKRDFGTAKRPSSNGDAEWLGSFVKIIGRLLKPGFCAGWTVFI